MNLQMQLARGLIAVAICLGLGTLALTHAVTHAAQPSAHQTMDTVDAAAKTANTVVACHLNSRDTQAKLLRLPSPADGTVLVMR